MIFIHELNLVIDSETIGSQSHNKELVDHHDQLTYCELKFI